MVRGMDWSFVLILTSNTIYWKDNQFSLNCLCSIVKIIHPRMYETTAGLFILLHWLASLSWCQYHTVCNCFFNMTWSPIALTLWFYFRYPKMSWLVFVLQYEFYSQLVRFHKKHARIFIAINFHLSISTKSFPELQLFWIYG